MEAKNAQQPASLAEFTSSIIDGPGGFKAWEENEIVVFPKGKREAGIADFVILCLTNPQCEGSAYVLEMIQARRAKKAAELAARPPTAARSDSPGDEDSDLPF